MLYVRWIDCCRREQFYKVKFKNIRTGAYSEVNSQGTPIIGISSFKNAPFIAVATQDNVISLYHIGDCGRKRILETEAGNYMMVVSPENTVIACSNGARKFQTFNFFKRSRQGRKWVGGILACIPPRILKYEAMFWIWHLTRRTMNLS